MLIILITSPIFAFESVAIFDDMSYSLLNYYSYSDSII